MTLYCLPWWMTSFPPTYSKMAESPPGSDRDRCDIHTKAIEMMDLGLQLKVARTSFQLASNSR